MRNPGTEEAEESTWDWDDLGLGRLGVEGARRLEEVAKAWEREAKSLPAEKALGGRGRVVPADVADDPRYKGMSYTCLEDIVVL